MKNIDYNYIVFILGYDMLNELLRISSMSACDDAYDACKCIADIFMDSEFYQKDAPIYDCLMEFVEDRANDIGGYISDLNSIYGMFGG